MSVMSVLGQFGGATAIGAMGVVGSGSGFNAMTALREIMNTPALNFVPIYATSHKVTREAVVSTSMVMSQSNGNKQFVTDNVAPQPRVWTISGYLKSLVPWLETGVVVYPTIILQKYVLDRAMLSRKVIPFKTKDSEFVDVVIKSLNMTDDPKAENTCMIDVVVQEMTYLTALSGSLPDLPEDILSISLPPSQMIAIGSAFVVSKTASVIGELTK